jgi:hypothetical protein
MTSDVANEATVFMLCGLCQQQKQPVGYKFICGGAKGEMLSLWMFMMSVDETLLPPCVTWLPTISRP